MSASYHSFCVGNFIMTWIKIKTMEVFLTHFNRDIIWKQPPQVQTKPLIQKQPLQIIMIEIKLNRLLLNVVITEDKAIKWGAFSKLAVSHFCLF